MGSSGSKHKKACKKAEQKASNATTNEVTCTEKANGKTDVKALKKAAKNRGKNKMSDQQAKKAKVKQRQQTKHPGSCHSTLERQIKANADPSGDSGHPPSTDSVPAQSVGTSEGSQELENVLTEQIRTLEREKHDLTADLSTLNVGPSGASEDENFSADDLDASSIDDLDTGMQHKESVTFDTPASPSKLNHLNKNRAPMQKKRPPARYSMFVLENETAADALQAQPSQEKQEEAESIAQAPQEKIKKKRGSKEKKKKKGKYNKKTDAKLDDSVVEV